MIDKKGCAASYTSPYKVIIYPELNSDVKFPKSTGCFKTSVTFTNNSNQAPPKISSYLWDFGDGSTDNTNWSTTKHDYVKDGIFDVRLIIRNTDGCVDTFVSKAAVKNTNFTIDAKVDSAISVCRSTNRFKFKQTVDPLAYIFWTYGDGDTMFKKFSFTHHYKQVGVYYPKFFISKDGCGKTVPLDSITVYGPQAAIGNIKNQYQCSIRDTITLNNVSKYYKNKALKFFWDVGDGFAPNCTSNTKKGQNTNNNCRYSVDSTGIRHMYKPGQEGCYNPMLIITDTTVGCSDTGYMALPLMKPNAKTGLKVFSKALCPGPEKYKRVNLDFSQTVPGCGQQSYWVIWDSAYAATTSNFDSNWRYMDTFHNYDYMKLPANKRVTIGVVIQNGKDTSGNECTDTAWYPNIIKFSNVNPKFTSSYNPKSHYCKNSTFTFNMVDTTQADSLTSIVWSWGDGTFTKVNNCKQISHKYKKAGLYKVILLLQHRGGCLGNDTMSLQVGYSHFFSPTVNQMCAGGNVTFYKFVNYWKDNKGQWYDTSRINKGLESFKWDFGDGNGFSNSQTLPTIQYNKMGNYKIQLATVDSAGCLDTSIYPNLFKVYKINADFTTIRDSFICAQQVAFTSTVSTYDSLSGIVPYSGVINSYKWTFGKGISNSSVANPSKFLKTGIYAVKLVVVTDQLCKDSIIKNVKIIGPKAYYEFEGDSTGCTPLKIKFKNKSTLAANFLWQFKDPVNNNVTYFTNSDTAVSWTYSAAGIVYPTLIASNNLISNGFPIACTSIFPDTPFVKTLRPVEVFGKPNMNFFQQIDCNNRIASFASQCYINKGSIVDYVWEFGDGDTSHAINPKHTYSDTGSYIVTLTAITDKGCVGKFVKTVRVPKGPIVSFYKKDVCIGNSIQFIDSLGTFKDKVYAWDWYFDDGNFSSLSNPLKTFSYPGKYSVLLKVYTLSGCTNSARKTVWVHSRPKTNFTFTNKCLTDTIKFNNTTTSDETPLKYFWRLGDGDTSTKSKLNKVYKTAGNYTVKLLAANPFGCADSVTKTVITYPLPNASFKINYHTTCKNGHRFVFNNTSTTDTGNLFYHWRFTNTDTSILKNPTYAYNASGKFTIKLIAKTNYNCRDTILDTVYVNPNPVSNKAIIPSSTVCINGTQFKFIDNSSIASGSWTRKWYTGDNNSATDSILSYNYKDTGNFTIKLTTLSNLNCPDSILFKVRVSPKPKANFTINNPNQCVNGNLFSFTNTSQGFYSSTTSRWQFGDGDSSSNANSTHTYKFQDTFTVRLIATNTSGCKDTIKKDIFVYPKPSAQFTIKDTLPCEINNKILFTNNSSVAYGTLTNVWNFGDTKTANTPNTSHSYDTFGTYAVRLITTSNFGCKDTITKNTTVHPMPMPAFKVNKQSQCLNSQNFIFTNLSTIGKDSFSSTWMLGENDSVKTKNASKQFKTNAIFKVSLILKSNKGCIDSTSMKVKIFPKPFPQYTVNDSTQCINGQDFSFTNSSTIVSGKMTYSWNLGNGFKTTNTPNTYRYANYKVYKVTLTATSDSGCIDSFSRSSEVYPKPASYITANDSGQCVNNNLFLFKGHYSIPYGTANTYYWNLDGTFKKASIDTFKQYSDTGLQKISFIAESSNQCRDTSALSLYVQPKPKANFSINNSAQCITGNLFAFTNTSQGFYSSTTSRWQFGDGDSSLNLNITHSYQFQDTFTVRLIATNTSGCNDTIKKDIIAFPKPSAQFTIKDTLPCETNNKILFTNTSNIAYGTMNHAWDFGDARTANLTNTSHSYDTFGTYVVRLITTSNYGCKDTITKNATVYPMPMPAFNVNKQSQCLNSQNFIFTNLSTIGKDSFTSTWMLGEKDSVKTKNASKQFKTAAIFKVSLILKSNKGCIDSSSMKVKIFPKPFPQYTVNDSTQCINGQAYTFTNTSNIQSGNMTYNWNLGNGFKTISTPSNYRYASYKVYKVTLTATSDSGCIDSFSRSTEVYPKPASYITANDSGQCVNSNLFLFKGHYSIPYGTANTYYWNIDGTFKKASIDTFKRYNDTGVHSLSFIAESINQCRDTSSLKIYLQPKPKALFSVNDSGQCENDNLFKFINASQFAFGNLNYKWNFGDGNTSTQNNPQNKYGQHDTLKVSLIASTNVNCQDTAIRTVIVYPKPLPQFNLSDSDQCLYGNKFIFNNSSRIPSGNVTYLWETGDGYQATQLNNGHSYTKEGTYKIKLHVTSDFGCIDSVQHFATVHPEPKADFTINKINQCQNNQSFVFTNQSTLLYGTLNYQWQMGDASIQTSKDVNYQYASHGLKTIQLKAITDKLCKDSISRQVRVYAKPRVSYAINDTDQCVNNQNLQFKTTTTIAEGSIKKHYWNFGDGVKDSGLIVSHYFQYTQLYVVTHIAISDSLCIDSVKKNIRIYPKPKAAFNINDTAQCLKNNNYLLSDASVDISGIKEYLWNIDSKRLAFTSIVNHQFSDTGYKKISLTITSNNGCRDTTERKVYVKRQPDASFTKLAPYYCVNGPMVPIVPKEKGGQFFGKNMVNDQYVPTKLWRDTVTYKIIINGCSDSVTYTTDVFPPPIVNLGKDTILCKYESITLKATNWNSTYQWNNTFMTDSIQKVNRAGTYIVKVTSVCGSTSDTIIVNFRDNNCRFFMPTAFTPNADDRNEYFKPTTINVPELTMRIFNRWGEKIYEGDINSPGWDGTYKGEPVQQDVYVWQVEYRYPLGNGYINQYENGTLNLLR